MNPIILVAETGSDITPELASKYNIKIVPMHVSFDNETLDDGAFPVQKICDYYQKTRKISSGHSMRFTKHTLIPQFSIWPIPQ